LVSLEAPEILLTDDDVRLQRVAEAIASVLMRTAGGAAAAPLQYVVGLKLKGVPVQGCVTSAVLI